MEAAGFGYQPVPHRRYEVNPELVPQFEAAGLRFVGKDDTETRMEIVELAGHPFFVAAQVQGKLLEYLASLQGSLAASAHIFAPRCPSTLPSHSPHPLLAVPS